MVNWLVLDGKSGCWASSRLLNVISHMILENCSVNSETMKLHVLWQGPHDLTSRNKKTELPRVAKTCSVPCSTASGTTMLLIAVQASLLINGSAVAWAGYRELQKTLSGSDFGPWLLGFSFQSPCGAWLPSDTVLCNRILMFPEKNGSWSS